MSVAAQSGTTAKDCKSGTGSVRRPGPQGGTGPVSRTYKDRDGKRVWDGRGETVYWRDSRG